MLFNSLKFLAFFPSVLIIYFSLKPRYRNIFLLLASYYFYLNWQPIYVVLILVSTLVTWLCSLFIENSVNANRKKIYLALSLIINFSILFFYKYFNFINQIAFDFLDSVGIRYQMVNLDILLPVGISFYTFQAVGYTIDVYRENLKHEKNIINYALFVSFFPQLVAGPIERAKNLLPQFREINFFSWTNFYEGVKLMLWGYFLKLVLADRLGIYVDAIYNNIENHNGSSIILASILFAFQIYGDFAGYSLIAIGTAKAMGFDLMANFRRPYFGSNIKSFWSRWHISLSTWFKDYLYIPLGGNRKSKFRANINLFLTFFISGIWHGANYTFVIWGALHGTYQIIEKSFGYKKDKDSIIIGFIKILITFLLVDFAWIFFRANTISDAFLAINKIFTSPNGNLFLKGDVLLGGSLALLILFIKEFKDEFYVDKINFMSNKNKYISIFYFVLLLSIILLFGVFDSDQFIYFQF
jgi:D-alanyl-lipoteichoic acid acyltransferase DltB (MBOAT superfamily)